MGLKGKMIGQTEIKAGGDVFHDIFKHRPHEISKMAPTKIQDFNLLEGPLGKVGSKVLWNYSHDGKEWVATDIITDINEEKQSLTLKVIEGDLMKTYKSMDLTYHVDTIGPDCLVTWTLDYEKLKEDYPHPGTLLNFLLHLVEDIEAHHS